MSIPDYEIEAARQLLAARRRRVRFLPMAVLGEPAWDILLDLLVSTADGVHVSLKSACAAAGIPSTTAMRYVEALTTCGLVRCAADPQDGRRKLLVLTREGDRAMRAAAADAAGALASVVGRMPSRVDVSQIPHREPPIVTSSHTDREGGHA